MFLSNLLSGSVENYYLEGGDNDNIAGSLILQELIKVYETQFGSIGPTPNWFLEDGIESLPTTGSKRQAAGFGACTECGGTLFQSSLVPEQLEISACFKCGLTHARGRPIPISTAQNSADQERKRIVVRIDEF